MELAIWVLSGLVALIGFAISNQLKDIQGRLNGLRGLISSDGPDPGFTSYLRMSAGHLSAIQSFIKEEIERRDRTPNR